MLLDNPGLMNDQHPTHILTINTGSSSLKAALYAMGGDGEKLLLSAHVDRIGLTGGHVQFTDGDGATQSDKQEDFKDHTQAVEVVLTRLGLDLQGKLDAVGHRVVHGGSNYSEPQLITPDVT